MAGHAGILDPFSCAACKCHTHTMHAPACMQLSTHARAAVLQGVLIHPDGLCHRLLHLNNSTAKCCELGLSLFVCILACSRCAAVVLFQPELGVAGAHPWQRSALLFACGAGTCCMLLPAHVVCCCWHMLFAAADGCSHYTTIVPTEPRGGNARWARLCLCTQHQCQTVPRLSYLYTSVVL